MSTNSSFWQDNVGVPGVIRESPVPSHVADGEILVKLQAWAMNPVDHILQDVALPFVKYPFILGEDVAGTVQAVGSAAASKFEVGDRVIALAWGGAKEGHGAFQDYSLIDHSMACKIPDSLSFAEASVFPLCTSTASLGLFAKNWLGMPFPQANPTSTGKSVLIWGGSSSVGSNAIQLSKAAGFDVVTTCSARNFGFVQGIGADKVFDYNSPSVVDDVVTELDQGTCFGIFHAAGSLDPSCQVSHRSKQKLFVATSVPLPEGTAPPEGVEVKFIFASDGAALWDEINPTTFGGFLPDALAKGVYKVAPKPEVVSSKGLDGIQEALDLLKKGVSGKKIVVESKE